MKKTSARGYLFEEIVKMLFKHKGFSNVKSAHLRGRGAKHQIDVLTFLDIPTPFINKMRIICEVKAYAPTTKISLPQVRSFVGVIKDISENYFVDPNKRLPERYTDVGVFFATNQFSEPAQHFAWAHNISLVSFHEYSEWQNAVDSIDDFLSTLTSTHMKGMSIENLTESFRQWLESEYSYESSNVDLVEQIDSPQMLTFKRSYEMATVNGTYPTFIEGELDWLDDICARSESDVIDAEKVSRYHREQNVIFNIYVKNKSIKFVLPDIVVKNLTDAIDISKNGDFLFRLDIPYHKEKNQIITRRIIILNVYLRSSNNI